VHSLAWTDADAKQSMLVLVQPYAAADVYWALCRAKIPEILQTRVHRQHGLLDAAACTLIKDCMGLQEKGADKH